MSFNFKKTWLTIRNIESFKEILPAIMAIVTQTDRYLPEIEWSQKSWVHNLFRCYECIFWRKIGIRPELSVTASNGKIEYRFHSFESALAHFEGMIRGRLPRKIPIYIHVPALAGFDSGISKKMQVPFLFSITFNAAAGSFSSVTSPLTFSHTCTGSNLLLCVEGDINVGGTISSFTYNSVSMTSIGSISFNVANVDTVYGNYLLAPATGSNTVSISGSGTSFSMSGCSSSYSGVKQSAQPDASTTNGSGTSSVASLTTSVTTVADNCWAVLMCASQRNVSADTGSTLRTAGSKQEAIFDSNGVIHPAGSYSMTFDNATANVCGAVMASFSPVIVVASTNASFLLKMV